ncbi:MAG: DsrE/DsrF/DrsH-like family protein, partial [Bacteroidales bacterium]|nr:DsrE/DsrF/DrsH-like family protein [Bacteroidales bacterium]
EYVLLPQSSSDFDLTAKRFKLSGDNNAIVVWTDNTSLNAYVAKCTNNEIEGAVSLDEDGTQSANCFVVSKPGKYSFSLIIVIWDKNEGNGVEFIACQMSMDVMGVKKEELLDCVTVGGVATYMERAENANVNLFI